MSGEMETYEMLDIFNNKLDQIKCKGRPPKWFTRLCEYLHYSDKVPMYIAENSGYSMVPDAKYYLNNTCAGSVRNAFYETFD